MKKNKILIFLVFFLCTSQVYGCNCNPGGTLEANVNASDVIIKARVISISYTNRLDTMNVVMEGDQTNVFSKYWNFYVKMYKTVVQKTYKGQLQSDTITIVTGMNGASCGFSMTIDKEYLVYGTVKDYLGFSSVQRKSTDGKLIWTNNCTRTWEFSEEEAVDVKAQIEKSSYKQ
jgi:hypothetical protein